MNLDLFKDNWLIDFSKTVSIKDIDIVVAGPPCQGFSLTGPRKLNDERNKLYKAN